MENVNKAVKDTAAYIKTTFAKENILPLLKRTAFQLLVVFISAELSGVSLFGGAYPFGLALIIGVSDRFALSALAGFVIGSFSGADVAMGATYIAAAGVVAATRWIVASVIKGGYKRSNYLPCLIAGLSSVAISELSVMALSLSLSGGSVLTLLGGLAMAGGYSFFYRTVFDTFKKSRSLAELSSVQKASLALVLCSVIMALYPLGIGPFSLGRLAGTALCVFAAYLLIPPLEAAVFASVAAAFIIQEPSFAFASAGVCIAGALASLFRKRSRGVLCVIFIVTSLVFAFCSDDYIFSLTYISEVMLASLIFLIVPVKYVNDAKFSRASEGIISATSAVSYKLDSISTSMQDITTLLDKTVKIRDERLNTEQLLNSTVDKLCRTCPIMSYCWVKCYNETADALNKLVPILLAKSEVTRSDLTSPLKSRCVNAVALCREITLKYGEHVQSLNKIKTTQLYKSLLKKQFTAVSEMLSSARDELAALHDWDEEKSKRVYDCAVRLGLPVETAGCVYDGEHRPLITVTLSDAIPEGLIKRLTAGISIIAAVPLSAPNIEQANGGVTLNYTERPTFTVDTSYYQISADDTLCGDVLCIFSDSKFNLHIVMSDGMGTGQGAARDGALCCAFLKRLLESGFRIKRAAELANTALAMREDSETASTLDALTVNVFTGEATLFKAGAAPTYFLHSNKIKKIEGKTLPVGILNTVNCKETTLNLSQDDIIVMMSDGAEQPDDPYIEQTLKNMYPYKAKEICAAITEQARIHGSRRDDVTVIVAKLEKFSAE